MINRQILELDVQPGLDSHQVQQNASWVYRNHVLPRLENLFDQLVDADTIVRLDRLEINLDSLQNNALDSQFVDRVLQKIKSAIVSELKQQANLTSANNPTVVPFVQDSYQLLTHFLKHGSLPWHASIVSWEKWEEAIIEALENASWPVRELFDLLGESPSRLDRLIWQFSNKVHVALLRAAVQNDISSSILELWDRLNDILNRSSFATGFLQKAYPELFWKEVYSKLLRSSGLKPLLAAVSGSVFRAFIASDEVKKQPVNAILSWLRDTGSALPELRKEDLYSIVEQLFLHHTQASDITQEEQELLERLLDNDDRYVQKIKSILGLPEKERAQYADQKDTLKGEELDQNSGDDNSTASEEVAVESTSVHLDEEPVDREWFIRNAGIVLLHPFLSRFFGTLGLASGDAFVDRDKQIRGIQLLQYLSTGSIALPETELILNKVLCGMPLQVSVPREFELLDEEIAEAESLLEAVITHWKALKKTSPDGLRFNFLLREGKLTQKSSGWHLRIETMTHDILLGVCHGV